jgi:hypothetical protein
MQLGVVTCVRVLHRDLGAELDMVHHRCPKVRVFGHSRRVERRPIQLDEPRALLLANAETPMDLDQMIEPAKLTAETIWTSERLGGERRQGIDMTRLAALEQWREQWVRQDAAVEGFL